MKLGIFIFLFSISVVAAEVGYTDKMIACDEKDERFVSEGFDAFLALVSRGEVRKESLHFTRELSTERPGYIIFDRGFYISPNEVRGFELVIPKACLTEKNRVFTLNDTVVVDQDKQRSGIRIFVLKKK